MAIRCIPNKVKAQVCHVCFLQFASLCSVRNLKAGEYVPFLKHASAAVYDIPSISTRGKTLGSVCYSDSFIDSSLTVSEPGSQICMMWLNTTPLQKLQYLLNGVIVLYKIFSNY